MVNHKIIYMKMSCFFKFRFANLKNVWSLAVFDLMTEEWVTC